MYINEKVFSRFYIYISNHKNNVEVQRERERERERERLFLPPLHVLKVTFARKLFLPLYLITDFTFYIVLSKRNYFINMYFQNEIWSDISTTNK